jgi:hypothetical protein
MNPLDKVIAWLSPRWGIPVAYAQVAQAPTKRTR